MPAKKTKTVKKATVKQVATKPAPVVEHKCECGEHCNCHCHGSAHWIKHIIVWAIIFALGMAAGKLMNCDKGHKNMPKTHPVFTNGCLDMNSIKNPKLREALVNADVDGNECISVEEYKSVKKAMRPERKPGQRNFKK